MSTLTNAFTQRPIESLKPEEGTFRITAPEETLQVKNAPYFGDCRLSQTRDRRVPPQWYAVLENTRVHAPSFAVTSGETVWQTETAAQLPYKAAGYSEAFMPVGERFGFAQGHMPSGHHAEAALVTHRTSFNYFHLIFDSVPKILALKAMDPQAKIPAIVDARLPLTLRQVLTALFEPERKLIEMPPGTAITVDRLHLFSTPSHLPDDAALDIDSLCVSPNAIRQVAAALGVDDVRPTADLLWISRAAYVEKYNRVERSSVRDISNNRKIEALLSTYGAKFFAPEEYVWQSQRDRFASAKAIAMVSGSAATNLLFAKPGTRVLLLCKNRDVNPGLFDIVMDTLGLPHAWVFGTSKGLGAHANFHIAEDDMRRAMEWLMHATGQPDGVIPTHAASAVKRAPTVPDEFD